MLTLLQLNLKRLSLARRQASYKDACASSIKAELLRAVTDMVLCTKRDFNVAIQSIALDTLLSGLEFFFATHGERGRWLLDLVTHFLTLDAARAAPHLRLVSRRLSVDPISSYMLQPPCEVEASNNLHLVVVSSDGGGSNDMGLSDLLVDSANRIYSPPKYRNTNVLLASPTQDMIYPSRCVIRAPIDGGYAGPVGFALFASVLTVFESRISWATGGWIALTTKEQLFVNPSSS